MWCKIWISLKNNVLNSLVSVDVSHFIIYPVFADIENPTQEFAGFRFGKIDNFSLQYRFSNSPGALKNQNANLNNLRFTSHFKSNNRKYELFFVFLSNKNASSENGGLQNPNKLDSLSLNDPYELETRLGKSAAASRNPFNTSVSTGNIYTSSQLDHHQLCFDHLPIGKFGNPCSQFCPTISTS
mgnify:CR=1 FL=1